MLCIGDMKLHLYSHTSVDVPCNRLKYRSFDPISMLHTLFKFNIKIPKNYFFFGALHCRLPHLCDDLRKDVCITESNVGHCDTDYVHHWLLR